MPPPPARSARASRRGPGACAHRLQRGLHLQGEIQIAGRTGGDAVCPLDHLQGEQVREPQPVPGGGQDAAIAGHAGSAQTPHKPRLPGHADLDLVGALMIEHQAGALGADLDGKVHFSAQRRPAGVQHALGARGEAQQRAGPVISRRGAGRRRLDGGSACDGTTHRNANGQGMGARSPKAP